LSNQGDSGDQYNIFYRNNLAWNAEGGAEIWLHGSGVIHDIYLENNTLVKVGAQYSHADRPNPYPVPLVFMGVPAGGISNIFVLNNILIGSYDWLLRFERDDYRTLTSLVFANNLIHTTSTRQSHGVLWGTSRHARKYRVNRIIGNSAGYWQYDNAPRVRDNLFANPLFTDFAGNDYTLSASSPAIHAGTNIADVTADYTGNTRPQDSRYDIGAYEYSTSGETKSLAGKNKSTPLTR